MKPAVVKTEGQYGEYMDRIAALVARDPEPDTPAGAELELLSLLVEAYEERTYAFAKPDPVEAVQFRMAEQDLRQADLVPYFGSRSRVSEFLSRQRPLTVQMIRELSSGLGIPADILIQESVEPKVVGTDESAVVFDWAKFPISEMAKRGWIQVERGRAQADRSTEVVRAFIEQAMCGARPGVLARRTIKGDAFTWQSQYALTAWQARVLQRASDPAYRPSGRFSLGTLNDAFFVDLVSLSRFADGPVRAVARLREAGIAVVVEEHLNKTKLDGAAMLSGSGTPVIGLTLRFDRIDNFWFTLLHECAHVWKHLNNPGDVFLDRLADKESTAAIEKEANRLARDLLIPRAHWKSASVRQMPTKAGIAAFAAEERIHPAIVAGRIQRESENYSVFADLVGQGSVRRLFV
jgi:HTH-type transcriptional regulator / antitoxin HigA